MTAKRVRVPAALHAELTEHTSLIRALRTASTLNLTAHLLRHADHNDADTWTQWPLIDCPVPEWSLADEIHHLAHVAQRNANANANADAELDRDPAVILHTGALLVRILSLMADQRPSAPGSMQNRLWPMNWQDVIALLPLGDVHPTVVGRAQARLERIYARDARERSSAPPLRTARLDAAKTRFATLTSIHEDQLFAPPILHPRTRRSDIRARPSRRRSMHARVKTRPIVETDTDVEA